VIVMNRVGKLRKQIRWYRVYAFLVLFTGHDLHCVDIIMVMILMVRQ